MLLDPERRWVWLIQVGDPAQGYAASIDGALEEVRRRFSLVINRETWLSPSKYCSTVTQTVVRTKELHNAVR